MPVQKLLFLLIFISNLIVDIAQAVNTSNFETHLLEKETLKKSIRLAGPVKKISLPDAIGMIADNKGGSAFYQSNLNWIASDCRQIIFTVKTNCIGRLRFACMTSIKGKRHDFQIYQVVKSDGKFHDYSFNLASIPNFQGTITNYELRWYGKQSEIILQKIRTLNNMFFTPAEIIKKEASREILLEGKTLQQNIKIAKPVKILTVPNAVGMIADSRENSAFHQQNLQWKTSDFKQIIFTIRTSALGQLRFACCIYENKKRHDQQIFIDVIPDGKFHDYPFNLKTTPQFQGIMTNYELRWFGEQSEIILKKVRTSQKKISASPINPNGGCHIFGRKLQSNIQIARGEKIKIPNAVGAQFCANGEGAFHQQNIAWNTSSISQIEFSLKTNAPGYFIFSIAAKNKKQKAIISCQPQMAMPDNEYHTYIFNLSEHKNWLGTATNWELKWLGGESAQISLNSIQTSPVINFIPNARMIVPGQEIILKQLKPRAECVFFNSEPSAGTNILRFYDRDLIEIPNTAVHLLPGNRKLRFTTPEMMIETRLTVDSRSNGYPVVQQLKYTAPSDRGKLTWRGNWLWCQNKPGPLHRNIWFERVINLEQIPESAIISFCGDDTCYAYVNSKFIGMTKSWTEAKRANIVQYLKKGNNRISCRVRNIDSWGGFIADIYIKIAGRKIFADTDSQWCCNAESNIDTSIPEIKGKPVVLGPANIFPWNNTMQFRYAGPCGRITPIKLTPGAMTVRILQLPPVNMRNLAMTAQDSTGKKFAFQVPFQSDTQWEIGKIVTIQYKLPYWIKGKAKLYLTDDLLILTGNPMLAELSEPAHPSPKLRKASFVGGSRPMLKLGNELIQPVFLHAPSAYKQSRLNTIRYWKKNNIQSYRLSASFLRYWLAENKYDFSHFDHDVAQLLTLVPNAVFAVHLYACMPDWWLAENPDDVSRHALNRPRCPWLDRQTWGSEKWLTDAEEPIKALIRHIKKSKYADRVWGISFADSRCGEWFWTSADATGKLSYAGYSQADYNSFHQMLQKKYKTDKALAIAWNMPGIKIKNAPMPLLEKARHGSIGTLLNPEKDMQMLDFFEFRNMALAKAILHFGKIAKQETQGKWLVGAYYGYFSEMIASPRRNIQSNGHNGFVETAQSPFLDFVHAPLRYSVRKTGQPGTMMHLWDTYLLHGKMVYIEQDVRTSYAPFEEAAANKLYCGTPDTALCDIGQFYRSFGMTVATGTLNYWYDLVMKQFDERVINETITMLNEVYLKLGPVKGTTPVETAIVSDRDSAYYTQFPAPDTPNTIASEAIFKHFNALAVPFRNLCIDDLLDQSITVPHNKLYIMLPTLVLTSRQRQKLMQRFIQEKATVIWLYAAGPFYPGKAPSCSSNADFLELKTKMILEKKCPEMLTNPEYGSLQCVNGHASSPWFYPQSGFNSIIGSDSNGHPLMVMKKIKNSTHYYSVLTDLPLELYAEIMKKIGVFRYRHDIGTDQYWIGNDVLFLYAVTNGEKNLKLPGNATAQAIIGPFKGTLRDKEKFFARAGMTYGFQIKK